MSNSALVSYTRISPNRTSPRKNSIDTITIHCVVGQVTAERLGEIFANPDRQASSNYGIDKDGRVGMYCEETDRSWCSGTGNAINTNDHRAITIEVASDTSYPYAVNNNAYDALIKLCVEICKRHGKKKLTFYKDRATTEKVWANGVPADELVLTMHKWFANTSCPGKYLEDRFQEIADRVTSLLSDQPAPASITFEVIEVKNGSKGEHVKQVQAILRGLGFYSGIVDGDAGSMTANSILRYQQTRGLYQDSIFGVKCWESFLNK